MNKVFSLWILLLGLLLISRISAEGESDDDDECDGELKKSNTEAPLPCMDDDCGEDKNSTAKPDEEDDECIGQPTGAPESTTTTIESVTETEVTTTVEPESTTVTEKPTKTRRTKGPRTKPTKGPRTKPTKKPFNCKDAHIGCGPNKSVCENDTYAIMMLIQCAETCGKCEDFQHMPTSKRKCKDTSLKCFRKSKRSHCKDEKIQAECPFSCGLCT